MGKVKKQMTPYSLGIHINANGNASSGLLGAAASASKLGASANVSSRGIGGLHQRLAGLGTSSRFVRGLVQEFQEFVPTFGTIGAAARAWAADSGKSMLGTLNPMRLYQMRQEAIRRETLRQSAAFETARKSLGAFQDIHGRWRHSRGRYLTIGELESIGVRKATPVMRGFGGLLGGLGGGARNAGRDIGGMNLSLGATHGLLVGLSGAAAAAATTVGLIAKSGFDLNVKEESQMKSLTAIMASIYEFRDKKTGALLDNEKELQAAGVETERIYRELKDRSLGAPGTTEDLLLVFQAALGPAGQAHATIEQIQDLTVKAVGAAKVLGGKAALPNMEIAARDVRQLLSGAASAADTPMFQLLSNHINMTTEAFNALPAPERFAVFAKALDKALTPAALKSHKEGWEGISESIDEYRQRAEKAFSEEMFKRSKKALGGLVSILGTSQEEVETNARKLGVGVADGIEAGVDAIGKAFGWVQEKVTPVIDFFVQTYNDAKKLLGQSDTLEQAGAGWKVIGDVLLYAGGGLLQLVGAAAGFVGLGLGAVLTGIGLGAKTLKDNVMFLTGEVQKLGGGWTGVLELGKNAWEGLTIVVGDFFGGIGRKVKIWQNDVMNGFDRLLIDILRWGSDAMSKVEGIPILGMLIGTGRAELDLSIAQLNAGILDRQIENKRLSGDLPAVVPNFKPVIPDISRTLQPKSSANVQSSQVQNLNITQNIQTLDPLKAADAGLSGMARAAATPFPKGITGLPITVVPR